MENTRRNFLKTAALTGLAATVHNSLPAQSPAPQRPNLLLLFPDQWRFDWMSHNQQLPLHTPNIDRLAATGTRFNHAIVASPLCAPSRACLASGKEYERCNVPANNSDYPETQPTLYGKLRASGYHTLGCGKMDLAKGSVWWGTDGQWRLNTWGFSAGINNAGKIDQVRGLALNNNHPADPYTTWLNQRGLLQTHMQDYAQRSKQSYQYPNPTPLPDDAYCDNWVTENCIRLLTEAPKDKPWFMQVNWVGPHDPEDITARMTNTVRGRNMPAVNGSDQFDPATNQMIRQNYTAMCENIDRGIGLILDHLAATNQLANTIIIFSSDHGEMLGDHGRWGKNVPYHPSTAVPLVVSGPGVKSGTTHNALISSIDLHATLLDFATLPQTQIDGHSFRALLNGATETHRRVVYSGLGGWCMVFDGRYKVITGFTQQKGPVNADTLSKWDPKVLSRPPLCFDLLEDPAELTNLANNMPPTAQALLSDLQSATYPA